jgi:hypothetical protein
MNTIKLTKLERKFGNAALPGSWSTVADNTANVEDISFTGLVLAGVRSVAAPLVDGQVGTLDTTTNSGNLGKGSDNLSYYFSALYNDALLGSGAVAGIVRGADWFLQLQATVDVTYNTTRRRRRQVRTFTPCVNQKQANMRISHGVNGVHARFFLGICIILVHLVHLAH